MKITRIISAVALSVFVLASPAMAQGITGTWEGEITRANGTKVKFIPILKQEGDKVTGRLTGAPSHHAISAASARRLGRRAAAACGLTIPPRAPDRSEAAGMPTAGRPLANPILRRWTADQARSAGGPMGNGRR